MTKIISTEKLGGKHNKFFFRKLVNNTEEGNSNRTLLRYDQNKGPNIKYSKREESENEYIKNLNARLNLTPVADKETLDQTNYIRENDLFLCNHQIMAIKEVCK